jgi:hypothetical protein
MAFGLQLTEIYTNCHTYQCYNIATFYLGHEDSPNGTVPYVCDTCAGELKKQILSADKEAAGEPLPFPTSPLPFEDEPDNIEIKTFEEMTVVELKSYCKEAGLTGYSDKNKAELIELIEGAE